MFFTEKKLFLSVKATLLKDPKIEFFQKGLTHAMAQKIQIFPLFVLGQNKTRNKV